MKMYDVKLKIEGYMSLQIDEADFFNLKETLDKFIDEELTLGSKKFTVNMIELSSWEIRRIDLIK